MAFKTPVLATASANLGVCPEIVENSNDVEHAKPGH